MGNSPKTNISLPNATCLLVVPPRPASSSSSPAAEESVFVFFSVAILYGLDLIGLEPFSNLVAFQMPCRVRKTGIPPANNPCRADALNLKMTALTLGVMLKGV